MRPQFPVVGREIALGLRARPRWIGCLALGALAVLGPGPWVESALRHVSLVAVGLSLAFACRAVLLDTARGNVDHLASTPLSPLRYQLEMTAGVSISMTLQLSVVIAAACWNVGIPIADVAAQALAGIVAGALIGSILPLVVVDREASTICHTANPVEIFATAGGALMALAVAAEGPAICTVPLLLLGAGTVWLMLVLGTKHTGVLWPTASGTEWVDPLASLDLPTSELWTGPVPESVSPLLWHDRHQGAVPTIVASAVFMGLAALAFGIIAVAPAVRLSAEDGTVLAWVFSSVAGAIVAFLHALGRGVSDRRSGMLEQLRAAPISASGIAGWKLFASLLHGAVAGTGVSVIAGLGMLADTASHLGTWLRLAPCQVSTALLLSALAAASGRALALLRMERLATSRVDPDR